jgi:7-cyano-7-deazaguanine synthase
MCINTLFLVSGGLDSTIAYLLYGGDSSIPVFIDYGQQYASQELTACRALFGTKIFCITDRILKGDHDIFIPCRNLFLALITLIHFKDEAITNIVLAGLKDDHVVDKNPQAFEEMSAILSKQSNRNVRISSPFWDKTKGEIVELFLERYDNAREVLLKTFSCYNPVDGACGGCPACLRWIVALESNGIRTDVQLNLEIVKEYLKKLHTYEPDRISRLLNVIKNRGNLLLVDIDGVLTIDTDGYSYEDRIPNEEAIDRLQFEYKNNSIIVLYSARYESDRIVTENWLIQYQIPYHALLLNKPPATRYIDDLSERTL